MNNLTTFLEKFKKFAPPDDAVRTQFIVLVKEIADLDIEKSEVKVRNGTIFVVADPAAKSELYMHKKNLLGALEDAFGKKAPKDIR